MAYVSSLSSEKTCLATTSQAEKLIKMKIPYRIFVGGIAFNTTKEELKDFFSRYGAVRDTKIIRDVDGLSKGYGFVTFYREEDAQKVMNMGTIFFKEKRLNISEAYRKQPLGSQQTLAPVPLTASTSYHQAEQPVYYAVNQAPQPMQMQMQMQQARTWAPVPGFQMAQQADVPLVWTPQLYYYFL